MGKPNRNPARMQVASRRVLNPSLPLFSFKLVTSTCEIVAVTSRKAKIVHYYASFATAMFRCAICEDHAARSGHIGSRSYHKNPA